MDHPGTHKWALSFQKGKFTRRDDADDDDEKRNTEVLKYTFCSLSLGLKIINDLES
jgi:hypothetical protein